jgi:hypothetical protein
MHKVQRVLLAASKLNPVDNHFHPFYDGVYFVEKWFFLISEKILRVYCVPAEVVPESCAQNKDHLIKVCSCVQLPDLDTTTLGRAFSTEIGM